MGRGVSEVVVRVVDIAGVAAGVDLDERDIPGGGCGVVVDAGSHLGAEKDDGGKKSHGHEEVPHAVPLPPAPRVAHRRVEVGLARPPALVVRGVGMVVVG